MLMAPIRSAMMAAQSAARMAVSTVLRHPALAVKVASARRPAVKMAVVALEAVGPQAAGTAPPAGVAKGMWDGMAGWQSII